MEAEVKGLLAWEIWICLQYRETLKDWDTEYRSQIDIRIFKVIGLSDVGNIDGMGSKESWSTQINRKH